jgi:hypothetical protein
MFTVTASTRLDRSGDTVLVEIRLRNTAAHDAVVSLGACALSVSLTHADQLGAQPVWDQARWQPNRDVRPSIGRVCPLYEVLVPAPAGVAVKASQLGARFTVAELLDDSLSAGLYQFTARIAFNDTTVVVALGSLPLRRP